MNSEKKHHYLHLIDEEMKLRELAVQLSKLYSKFGAFVYYMSANTVDIFPHGKNMKVEEKWKKRIMEE